VEIEALLAQGSSQRFIANRYGTTESNFHNWMQKHGIKKPVMKDMNNAENSMGEKEVA
jgi:transposase